MDILIISTEEIHKKTHGREKVLTLQKTIGVLTKNQNTNPRKILGVFTKFHEIWMSY